MLRFLLPLIFMLAFATGLPSRAQSGYFDKCTQTEDSLMSAEEMDWLPVPVPDSNQANAPANIAPLPAQTAPAATVGGTNLRGHAQYQPVYFVQPAGSVAGGAAYQYYHRPGAYAVRSPAASGDMLAIPYHAGYGAYQPLPMYAPGAVPGHRMQPAGAYYPIIIIQQQVPTGPAAGSSQPPAQSQTAAQTPAQPQTLTQAITQALTQAKAPQAQTQAGAADPQASKSGFKGFVDAFLGAGSTIFPSGYAGGGFTLARPVLDLLLNTF